MRKYEGLVERAADCLRRAHEAGREGRDAARELWQREAERAQQEARSLTVREAEEAWT